MLYWSIMFFIVSIVAALFGFGGIAAASSNIAQILFFIFAALFVISLIFTLARKGDNVINRHL
ncbi:MAG: DUF1328 domain-containing protein [Bdellovibrionales bacterium]|nr:DUF1328 domain-containing protein [Bdellovibrionales bacterium]